MAQCDLLGNVMSPLTIAFSLLITIEYSCRTGILWPVCLYDCFQAKKQCLLKRSHTLQDPRCNCCWKYSTATEKPSLSLSLCQDSRRQCCHWMPRCLFQLHHEDFLTASDASTTHFTVVQATHGKPVDMKKSVVPCDKQHTVHHTRENSNSRGPVRYVMSSILQGLYLIVSAV